MTIELGGGWYRPTPPTTPVPVPTDANPKPEITGHAVIFVFHNGTGSEFDDLHFYTSPAKTGDVPDFPGSHSTHRQVEGPKIKGITISLVDDKGKETGKLNPDPAPQFGGGVHEIDLKFPSKIAHCTNFKVEVTFDSPGSGFWGLGMWPTLGGTRIVGEDPSYGSAPTPSKPK